ncbi:arylesterase [Pseudoruegeria sp. SK021]|uniref:arylesterase n=1 Tax=Pseudoruegeria sp. SK021 TaxID=1933035 RepID=UPI000A25D853|nr:arylesterase [Pseudoruegeria sp. SK021]OSP54521.1 arylesterase [Pseudoruegeria sp. SK021]
MRHPLAYGATAAHRKRLSAVALVAVLSSGAAVWAEPVTIAALGDSLTQGYGLPEGDGFVPKMDQWLQDHGAEAIILNAGVSGDTTAGGLSRLGWTLTPDVDAMIVFLGGNDMLRGLDPATSRANLDAILSEVQTRNLPVLLIGLPAAGNYGATFKSDFDAIYPELAAKYGTLLVPDFFAALQAQPGGTAAIRQRYFQADGIHPNPDGVTLIVDQIGPEVAKLIELAQD